MKATIASTVLGAAVLANAASIPHGHAMHTHARRGAQVAKRSPLQFLSLADASRLDNVMGKGWGSDALVPNKVVVGKNVDGDTEKAPVVVGGDGPFVVEIKNDSPDDIIVVSWSNLGKANPWDAAFVTQATAQPDVTHTLKSNTSTSITFDPNQVDGKSISGSMAAIYPNTILSNGMIYDTWMEYTYKTTDQFSTTDVSRLVNMNGNKVEVHNYANKDDDEPACSSTMDRCSFVCPEGVESCKEGGLIQNCPVGTPGTTASADKKDGGCGGMRIDGGFMKVIFS